MSEYISNNLEETKKIAYDFAASVKPEPGKAKIIGLYGELGSGKTTFMKFFAEYFGVEETIQSPTFIIMKIFELKNSAFKHLVHIDAYRLEKAEELSNLGWQELISHPGNLICVEWPERVKEIMPEHLMLRFEHAEGEGQRKVSIA